MRNDDVVSLDSVGSLFYRNDCILSVHYRVLFLVHILGRRYETEKKILQNYVEMCTRRF